MAKPIEQMTDEELSKLSEEELRQAAFESLTQPLPQQTEAQPQQPTAKEPKEPKEPAEQDGEVQEVDEVVYRRVIDLGDGSGTQVFEAPSMEELIDKLAKAQEHATRKIREQAQALKDKTPPKQMTEEEKFLLQQRMVNDPDTVINEKIDQAFQSKYGSRIAELEAAEKGREGTQTALDWMAGNPDYHACDKNGQRMEKWLALNQLDVTPENLTLAFQDLSESGLLVAKPADAPVTPAETAAEAAPEKRIAQPVVTSTVRRKVVGEVSTKRQAPVEKTTPGLTEADLYKMPIEELERLTYQELTK